MDNKILNFALIGCGRIAKRHSELLGNDEIKGGCLVAVCDVNIDRAKRIADKFLVPFYDDFHKMMKAETIDVVVVLTHSGNHADIVIQLAKDRKHTVVEKPMALTLNDADRMIYACDKNSIKLFVVKQNRFNLPVIKLREALDQERFGRINLGTVRVRWCRPQEYYDQDDWRGKWETDGGVLANQASHHIDLLEWMLGEVISVIAIAKTTFVNIEVEDTACVLLKFKSGAFGIVEATTATRPQDLEGSLSILGEKGSVVIEGFAVNKIKTWNFVNEIKKDKEIVEKFSVNPPNVYGFGHKEYYNHIIDCIKNNKKQLVDGLEGRKSLELIAAIYESIETGKEVFLRFQPKKCKLGLKDD